MTTEQTNPKESNREQTFSSWPEYPWKRRKPPEKRWLEIGITFSPDIRAGTPLHQGAPREAVFQAYDLRSNHRRPERLPGPRQYTDPPISGQQE